MKIQKLLLCSLFCLSMTGCNIFFRAQRPDETESVPGTPTEVQTDAPTEEETGGERRKYPLQTYTVENVTFSVPAYLEHKPMDGYEGTFMDNEMMEAYQLQGVSPLGSYTPDEFFTELTNSYRESYAIERMDGEMSPFTTSDGLEGYVGRVEMISSDTFFAVDLLAVPQKNMVVTFSGQCRQGQTLSLDIRELTETAAFPIATEDVVTGHSFAVGDGSYLELQEDGSFLWYEKAGDPASACVSGVYDVFRGQTAVDRVAYMEEYGLTYEELDRVIRSGMNGYTPGGSSPLDFIEGGSQRETYHVCPDGFYAVILHNVLLSDGDSVSEIDTRTLYVGFYVEDLGILDLTNCNTASHTVWTIE